MSETRQEFLNEVDKLECHILAGLWAVPRNFSKTLGIYIEIQLQKKLPLLTRKLPSYSDTTQSFNHIHIKYLSYKKRSGKSPFPLDGTVPCLSIFCKLSRKTINLSALIGLMWFPDAESKQPCASYLLWRTAYSSRLSGGDADVYHRSGSKDNRRLYHKTAPAESAHWSETAWFRAHNHYSCAGCSLGNRPSASG